MQMMSDVEKLTSKPILPLLIPYFDYRAYKVAATQGRE